MIWFKNSWITTFCLIAVLICLSTAAEARTYRVDSKLVGEAATYHVQPDDTLYDIARRYDMGVIELLAANPGTDLWKPKEGSILTLPSRYLLPDITPHGIVINIAELRLYYFTNSTTVMTFPIGIGMEGSDTPEGITMVTAKRKDPVWIPPESIRKEHPDLPAMIPSGSNNPLGEYALNLGWPRIVIHGTNRSWSIGTRSSHGCIRMYPEDIAVLFHVVEKGTKVTVINQPISIGLVAGKIYLEAHPTLTQSAQIYDGEEMDEEDDNGLEERIISYLSIMLGRPDALMIDWEAVENSVLQRRGQPVVVSK